MAEPCTLVVLYPPASPTATRAVDELQPIFSETLLCVDQMEPFLSLGLGTVTPWLQGEPSLVGLHAALVVSQNAWVLAIEGASVASQDPNVLRYLVRHPSEAQVLLLAADSGLRLLPGRFHRACMRPLERALQRGCSDPGRALRGLRIEQISEAETEFI